MTTNEIDKAVHQMIIDNGAYPSPLGYGGFPKSVCTSVNECMCHGIPDSRQLQVPFHPLAHIVLQYTLAYSYRINMYYRFYAGWRYYKY